MALIASSSWSHAFLTEKTYWLHPDMEADRARFAELRNGDWEYQAFTPAKAVNASAKLNTCFECHLPKKSDDYVFLYGKMAGK